MRPSRISLIAIAALLSVATPTQAGEDAFWNLWLDSLSGGAAQVREFGGAPARICGQAPEASEPAYFENIVYPPRDACWDEVALHRFVTESDFEGQEFPGIVKRKEWGAMSPRVSISAGYAHTLGRTDSLARARMPLDKLKRLAGEKKNPTGIVIHHAAGTEGSPIREIQAMHIGDKGWDDIGYHYLVGRDPETQDWVIYEGHSKRVVKRGGKKFEELALGTHAFQNNTGNIGICIIGDYEPASLTNPAGYKKSAVEGMKRPPPEAVALVTQLVEKLSSEYTDSNGESSIKQIYGHGVGEHALVENHTSCPGEGCLALVEALRMRMGFDFKLSQKVQKGERKPECLTAASGAATGPATGPVTDAGIPAVLGAETPPRIETKPPTESTTQPIRDIPQIPPGGNRR